MLLNPLEVQLQPLGLYTYFMHQVTKSAGKNNYVRCLLIVFSKAFDKVDHIILVQKLKALDLPVYVVNWICSFLTGRSNVNGHLSKPKSIGLSVVQAFKDQELALCFTQL